MVDGGDVIIRRGLGQGAGCRVLDDVELLEGFVRVSCQQAVAQVQYRKYEGMVSMLPIRRAIVEVHVECLINMLHMCLQCDVLVEYYSEIPHCE